MLGFERLEVLLERCAKSAGDGFPPFNIELRGETAYRIVLAVAGFALPELSITLDGADLTVSGQKNDGGGGREYLHQGIAGRRFRKTFLLAAQMEVVGASLENGLLFVDLVWRKKESVNQTIPIQKLG